MTNATHHAPAADPTRGIAVALDQIDRAIETLRICYAERGDLSGDDGPWYADKLASSHRMLLETEKRRARRARQAKPQADGER